MRGVHRDRSRGLRGERMESWISRPIGTSRPDTTIIDVVVPGSRTRSRSIAVQGTSLPRKAVVLLSGGLDSTTTLAIARSLGYEPYAMSFRYGQRHVVELKSAQLIAARMGVSKHVIVDIDLRQFRASALTADIPVPKGHKAEAMPAGIPVTYVPARNTVFLSFALAWAETLGSQDIFIGVNALDYSGYPDCRPEYIEAYDRMANLATRAGVEGTQHLKIHTPLIDLTKAQTIQ